MSSKKRKASTSRATPAPKIAKIVDDPEEFGEQSNESFQSFDELEDISTETAALPVYESTVTGKMVVDEGIQTVFEKYMLSAKVETMILKNEVSTMKDQGKKL